MEDSFPHSSNSTRIGSSSKQDLQNLDKFLDETTKEYCCNICSYKSKCENNIITHLLKHSDAQKKRIQCRFCPRVIYNYSWLENHERMHTSERPYKCEKCNFSHAFYSRLKKHMRIHNVERPYKCEECNFSFKTIYSLKRHFLIHSRK